MSNKKKEFVIMISAFPVPAYEICSRISKYFKILLVLPSSANLLISNVYENLENKSVKILYVGKHDLLFKISMLFRIALIKKPKIIHLFTAGGFYGYIATAFAFLYKLIVLCTYNRVTLVSTVMEPFMRKGIKFLNYIDSVLRIYISDYVIVTAKYIERMLKKRKSLKLLKKAIVTVPDGEWDAPAFIKFNNSSENLNYLRVIKRYKRAVWILFFGRVLSNKGLEYLIRAIPIIGKSINDFKVIIAGKGAKKYKYLADKLKIPRETLFIYDRYINYREGALLFNLADVVVLPYIEGTTSGIVPVAYAFKKPIVVTALPGFLEQVINLRTGIIVPVKNEKCLAKALIFLINNKSFREQLGTNGYKFYREALSYDKISSTFIKLYKEIIHP